MEPKTKIKRNWKEIDNKRKRKERIGIRVSESEKTLIKDLASKKGMNIIDYFLFLIQEVEGDVK